MAETPASESELLSNFINGRWTPSSGTTTMDVHNPARGTVIARVPMSTARDVDAAVQAYRQLVLAPLQGMDGYQRAYLLVDRDSGHALSISLWDSLDAMRGSEEAADRLRDQVT